MKLNDWIEIWAQTSFVNIKERSHDVYNYYLTFHILERLGNLQVEEISQETLQSYVLSLALGDKCFSSNTIAESFRVLKACLLDYYEKYDIKPVKFKGVKIPTTARRKIRCFTEGEQRRIENRVNLVRNPSEIGVLVSLYTGLRLGEVLALTWNDVDFSKNLIYIDKALYYKGKQIVISTPKTPSSIRVIPIPQFLLVLLRERKKHAVGEYVVADEFGLPIIPRTYQYRFYALLKRAKVERRGFHSLRHTFATRALECGMDVKSLADVLGHANPVVTLKRYAHSMLDYKKTMMNKIGKLYSREY